MLLVRCIRDICGQTWYTLILQQPCLDILYLRSLTNSCKAKNEATMKTPKTMHNREISGHQNAYGNMDELARSTAFDSRRHPLEHGNQMMTRWLPRVLVYPDQTRRCQRRVQHRLRTTSVDQLTLCSMSCRYLSSFTKSAS